jgi:cell wall-associated NlpC family hydrolase
VPVSGSHKRKFLSLSLSMPLAVAVAATLTLAAAPAQAAAARPAQSATSLSPAIRAFDWARSQAGKPYVFGATGPSGFDCSGLVMEAYRHAGIKLPRTTYGMLASPELVRVSHPVKGDLAFYGSGHVELYAHGDFTFGAHSTGQAIGWLEFGPWWHPTAYYRVR